MVSIKYRLKISILVLLFITSCTAANQKENRREEVMYKAIFKEYPYSSDLDHYLKNFLVKTKHDTIFFVPLNSCKTCVQHTLESLAENNFSDLLVVGGKIDANINFEKIITKINNSAHVVRDSLYEMVQYNIDVFGPTLIINSSGHAKYIHIESENLPLLLDSISWRKLYE